MRILCSTLAAVASLPVAAACAQCDWAAIGAPSTNNSVYSSTLWDPDGAGPLGANLVVGGNFTTAGGVSCRQIAMWDGATWSPLGTGFFAPGSTAAVHALCTLHTTGELVAGGDFQTASGVSARYIARWNGSAWSAFTGTGTTTTGMDSPVLALAVAPNGALFAAGAFTVAGGTPCSRVARWTGTGWSPLNTGQGGSGGVSGTVHSMIALPNGNILVGGTFNFAVGTQVRNIAQWNAGDGTWSALANGLFGTVLAIARTPAGDIFAGGGLAVSNGAPSEGIARWDGLQWLAVGTGIGPVPNSAIAALAVLPSGELIAGGQFGSAGGIPSSNIAMWHANAWSPMSTGMNAGALSSAVYTLTPMTDGSLVAGGYFTSAGGVSANYLAQWQCDASCPSDFNDDGVVDFFDYLDFVDAFAANNPAADFNGDSVIDFFDYLDFVDFFSGGC